MGAFYDGTTDVSGDFIRAGIVGDGWDAADAPELHQYFRAMKVVDVVYIKSAFGGGDITIKAIGLIADDVIKTAADTRNLVSIGRNVIWISKKPMVLFRPKEK